MSKRQRDLERVEKVKENIRDVSTDELIKRYNSGYLSDAGRVAHRKLIVERGAGERIGK